MVVLFKNKKRKKIIKSFVRKNRAEIFFNNLCEYSDKINFRVEFENSKKVHYEIAIITTNEETQLSMFKQDELGRNVKIELTDSEYKIIKIQSYNLPEKIYDWNKEKRISFEELVDYYFSTRELKSVYSLNNKLIIQIEDQINLFSLKNSSESKRLIEILQNLFVSTNRYDCIFSKDLDTIHRKYLYNILEKNGIDKKKLYRQSTTFSEKR